MPVELNRYAVASSPKPSRKVNSSPDRRPFEVRSVMRPWISHALAIELLMFALMI